MAVTQLDGGRQIRAGTITNAEIAAAAGILTTKLANGADFIQRGGTVAYTADQSHGGFKITSLGTPTASTDAATKAYVDATKQGLDLKDSVRASTTVNGALATAYENGDIIDGVTLATGDRILIKDQTTGSENGIYTVNATGAPTRAIDADTSAKVNPGMYTFVEQGTANADAGWVMTNDGAVTLGTTALTFSQFSGAGQVVAGAGLTKTANTLDVIGTANRIVVTADQVDIGTDVTTNAGTQTLTNKSISGGQITSAVANATLAAQATAALGLKSATTTVDVQSATAPTTGQVLTATGTAAATWQTPATGKTFTATTITGTQNGTNPTFTLGVTPNPAGSEQIFENGALLNPGAGNDYTISGATVTMLTTAIPVAADVLRAYAST